MSLIPFTRKPPSLTAVLCPSCSASPATATCGRRMCRACGRRCLTSSRSSPGTIATRPWCCSACWRKGPINCAPLWHWRRDCRLSHRYLSQPHSICSRPRSTATKRASSARRFSKILGSRPLSRRCLHRRCPQTTLAGPACWRRTARATAVMRTPVAMWCCTVMP